MLSYQRELGLSDTRSAERTFAHLCRSFAHHGLTYDMTAMDGLCEEEYQRAIALNLMAHHARIAARIFSADGDEMAATDLRCWRTCSNSVSAS